MYEMMNETTLLGRSQKNKEFSSYKIQYQVQQKNTTYFIYMALAIVLAPATTTTMCLSPSNSITKDLLVFLAKGDHIEVTSLLKEKGVKLLF